MKTTNIKKVALLALALGLAAAQPAVAETIAWTDWTSATPGVPGVAAGTISQSGQLYTVNYTGEISFAQLGTGTNYWTEPDPGNPAYTGNTVVDNAPTPSEMIALNLAGPRTITFDPPVQNPILAIVSMGRLNLPVSYAFDQPFTILGVGRGFWGTGTFATDGNTLTGKEAHGVIQFDGLVSAINWDSQPGEFWHGITVGLPAQLVCWEEETAWSAGERYATRGNWATYTDISGESPLEPVILYAAQNLVAGTVDFVIKPDEGVDIIITLNDGFRFAVDEDENLKIQGYEEKPSGNPSPGQFAYKSTESGKSATVNVEYYDFYGVHVDVEVVVDCPVVCESEYLLEVTSVNGNTNFSHAFTLTLDSEGNLTGTGYSNYHQWEETLSDFVYELNADGEITYVSFKAVYPNAYTWYPAFQLIDGGSLLFVEVNGPDNVNSATGTWTTKEECVAN